MLIEPGKLNQKAYDESFDVTGVSRMSHLDEHWFTSLRHVQVVIEAWRRECNNERPKKTLSGLTLTAYAKLLAEKPDNLSPDYKSALLLNAGGCRLWEMSYKYKE